MNQCFVKKKFVVTLTTASTFSFSILKTGGFGVSGLFGHNLSKLNFPRNTYNDASLTAPEGMTRAHPVRFALRIE